MTEKTLSKIYTQEPGISQCSYKLQFDGCSK